MSNEEQVKLEKARITVENMSPETKKSAAHLFSDRLVYVRVARCNGKVHHTKELVPNQVFGDFDENDNLLGVEIV